MEIREIKNDEMKSAIDLIWKTFLEYEAPDYSEEGIEEFKGTINNEEWIKARKFIGAFENNILVGVIATKDDNHIALFFVDGNYHKKGIGKRLYNTVKRNNITGFFTVNSSPYAHEVYKHLGFDDIGNEQVINGLRFYPMKATLYKKIELKQLSTNMGQDEYDMLQGILDVENGFTNPAYNLSYEEYKNWLQDIDKHSKGIDLPEGWIPYTTYILYIDDIPVGYGRIRHSSSEYLETVVGAGNLGYGISKEYRGKGYGNILFKELLKKCKQHGYNEIKLFPLKSNIATVNIMIKNGGKIIGEFKETKHIISIPVIQENKNEEK